MRKVKLYRMTSSMIYLTEFNFKSWMGFTLCRVFFLLSCFSTGRSVGQDAEDVECDSTIYCSINSDNSIFKPNREFIYLLKTTVSPKNFRERIPQDSSDVLEVPILLNLKVLPECFFNQTRIKYEYIVGDSVYSEITGLVENKNRVWIHPPRSLIKEVSYSPFFDYRVKTSKWRETTVVVGNSDVNISDRKVIWAKTKYSVANDTIFRFDGVDLKCKKIQVTTKHKNARYQSVMLFNDKLGFVSIDVHFINDKSYSLELIGYDPNYCR